MVTSKKLRNIIISALTLMVVTMPLQAQSPESDQLLKSVPGDSLFCIRINSFNDSLNQMDQFLTGISPVGVSMLLKAQLTNLLGSPQLAGLNMNGNFGAFGVVLPSPDPVPAGMPNVFIAVLVPVTNYRQFTDGISSKTPADANGIVKVLSLGNPVILLTQYGDYALAAWANEYDNLVTFRKQMSIGTSAAPKTELLRSTLSSAQAKQAVSQPFWVYANVQQVSKAFAPLITSGLAGIRAAMQNMPAANTGVSTESLQSIMNMYVSVIETILKEIKSVSLSLNPTPTVLNISKITAAVPGTEIAKMFAANPSAERNNLLPYLEDGAMTNIAFTLNSPMVKQGIDLEISLLSALGGQSVNSQDLQKMKSIAENMIETVKGPAAYTISVDPNVQPPFKGDYLIAVKDPEKFKQLMDQSIQLMATTTLTNLYKSMGIEMSFNVSKGVENYKGVSIDAAKLSFKFVEPNAPQAQMLAKMYGSGFDYRWGMVKDLFVVSIGTEAQTAIHKLIDKIQAGGATQLAPEIKKALSLVPDAETADFFATFNLLRIFRLISSFAAGATPVPLPSINVPTTSNFVLDGKAADGTLTVNIALPKEHVQEIMRAVMTLQQEMMKNRTRPAGTL